MSSLYPQVDQSNPEAISYASSSSKSKSKSKSKSNPMYPSIEVKDLAENLFPDNPNLQSQPSSVAVEEVLIQIPGTIVHLIDEQQSVELASGDLTIVRLRQGENVVAVLARVGDEIQWPLAKDEAAVKLDESHYFFTLRVPSDARFDDDESGDRNLESDNILNYGVTIASKGQKGLLKEFDSVLEKYSAFSVEKVAGNVGGSVVARETSPEEMESGDKMALMEGGSAAYWTTLAPNVEDYSSGVAKMIAAGSGHLIRGILWCGDVTVERLKWGDMFFRIRLASGSKTKISPEAMKRMKRVKKMTKMSEKMATGILSGVVKVSGFFTSSIVNSKVGNKFFSLLPGEIVLATLDGFNKVCDAVEVSGRNVMSTTSVVTTGLVSHRYGEEAGKVTNEGMDAAGHAIGTAWAVFKIRQAINPKSAFKPTSLVKAAARTKSDLKSKSKKK